MRIDYRTKGARERVGKQAISAFNKGEKTTYEADRMAFDTMQVVKNFYSNKGNAKLRNGYEKLIEIEDLKKIFIYRGTDNDLIGSVVDTDTSIVKIDREDGSTTDLITGITGTATGYFEELRGILYYSNAQTDLQVWDGTTATTLSFDYGVGAKNAGILASDESRVWAVSQETPTDVLAFSKDDGTGKVTTFNTGGADINRSGIASSRIKTFTALKGMGKSILAIGTDRVEVHAIPDFATNGITSFPANVSTLINSYEDIGVESSNAVVAVGDGAFFKANDDKLYRISSSGKMKVYTDELGLWKDIDWSNCSMAYDPGRQLVYIAGEKTTPFDIMGVFNITDESFSTFTDIYGYQWAGDKANLYFLSGEIIYDAFGTELYTDDTLGVEWELRTQMTYGNTKEYFKVLREVSMAFQLWENTDIKMEAIINRGTTSDVIGESDTIEEVFEIDVFSTNPESFGGGVWGGSNIKYNTGQGMEKFLNSIIKNTKFFRLEIRITGKSKSPLEFKEIGVKYLQTAQKVNTIKYA